MAAAAPSLVFYFSLLLLRSCSYGWRSDYDSTWKLNHATWYGTNPLGDGSNGGGACGYGPDIDRPPFYGVIASGSATIFQGGQGCGDCYELRCTVGEYCSNNTVRVVVTDSSLNIYDHDFDLSGIAFRKMAKRGHEDDLENMGYVPIIYRQVECKYNGLDVTFRVNSDLNPYYFAVAVEYENKGALTKVEIRHAYSYDSWITMSRSWGAIWRYDGPAIFPPFSFRLTEHFTRTIVAENVIPFNYAKGNAYKSTVNF